MRNTVIITLLILISAAVSAQNTILLSPQKSAAAPTPPVNRDARRAAAVAKVQGGQVQSAKGLDGGDLTPQQYSTSEPMMYSTAPNPATTLSVHGDEKPRDVRKGRGQVYFGVFTPVTELHFVQFGVFCKNTPVTNAPDLDGVYLIWHAESTCPGAEQGAAYIVKGYPTAEEAKAAVLEFKARGMDCWYNPALTGAEVEIIGVR